MKLSAMFFFGASSFAASAPAVPLPVLEPEAVGVRVDEDGVIPSEEVNPKLAAPAFVVVPNPAKPANLLPVADAAVVSAALFVGKLKLLEEPEPKLNEGVEVEELPNVMAGFSVLGCMEVEDFVVPHSMAGAEELGARADGVGTRSFGASKDFAPKRETGVPSEGLEPKVNGREVIGGSEPLGLGLVEEGAPKIFVVVVVEEEGKLGTNPPLDEVVDGLVSVEPETLLPPNRKPSLDGAGIENVFATGAEVGVASEAVEGVGDLFPSYSFWISARRDL
jgi:hypothetical protein